MVMNEREARLCDRTKARAIAAWASAWWDLRVVGQILHDRVLLGHADSSKIFTRRGMIEGAIATYGRCFVDGTRYHTALLLPIVEGLGSDAVGTHDEAMRWRHRHVAHRLESAWEQSEVSYLWTTDDALAPQMRVRLITTLGPDDEFADRLAEHSTLLANRVWEDRLVPLKEKYISETPVERLRSLSSHHAAQAPSIPVSDPDHLGVTLNL
ncbi:MAG: hypothetical protein ACRDRH_24185 [Pseudonocardia sp.]